MIGKILGPMTDSESTNKIEKEKQWHEHAYIEGLILQRALVKGALGFISRFQQTRANEAQIIKEKQPDKESVARTQAEPGQRALQAGKKDRFAQGAGDVEKIMTKLQRPSDHGEGVNDRARPEDKNHT